VNRRSVLQLAGATLVAPWRALAQTRIARIGYLVQSPLVDPPSAERAAFIAELDKLGWTVGRNLEIEYRSAENEPAFLEDQAKDLAQMNLDVIVAASGVGAGAAKMATSQIPIVFTQHPDPVGAGLVRSLAHPGSNVTGVSYVSPELAGKRLELLREVLPSAHRIAMIWASYIDALSAREVRLTASFAKQMGMGLETRSIGSAESLVAWFEQVGRSKPEALIVLADLKMVSYRDILVEHGRRLKLPIFAGWPDVVRAGALLSYSPSFVELFRRSAHYVNKILRGAKPGDLPVEQPTGFHLAVNLSTARALGLKVPQSVLLRADEVIE
jgi:putative ABC transport system substrate-binding protein